MACKNPIPLPEGEYYDVRECGGTQGSWVAVRIIDNGDAGPWNNWKGIPGLYGAFSWVERHGSAHKISRQEAMTLLLQYRKTHSEIPNGL